VNALAEAEIAELHFKVLRQQDIFELQIKVCHLPLTVHALYPVENLMKEGIGDVGLQGSSSLDKVKQVPSLAVLELDVERRGSG
jgi:hypothetical protein